MGATILVVDGERVEDKWVEESGLILQAIGHSVGLMERHAKQHQPHKVADTNNNHHPSLRVPTEGPRWSTQLNPDLSNHRTHMATQPHYNDTQWYTQVTRALNMLSPEYLCPNDPIPDIGVESETPWLSIPL